MRRGLQIPFLVLFILAGSIFGQDLDYGMPGKTMVGPRLGFFSASHSASVDATPLMGVQVEVPWTRLLKTDKDLFRSMGLGFQFLYESWSSSYKDYGDMVWPRKYSHRYITLLGTYYYSGLKVKAVRPFGRLNLGFNTTKIVFNPDDPEFSTSYDETQTSKTKLCLNLSAGVRCFVVPNVALTVELGFGISTIMVGADYCF